MNDYLYVFRGGMDPNASPAEMQANLGKWGAWIEDLSKRGVFVAGQPLAREGKVIAGAGKVVTDGPYAEAKDLVGGYLIVKSETLAGAAELSRGCPIFESGGSVEVRPISKLM